MDILTNLSNAAIERAIQFNRIGFLEYFGRFEQVTLTHAPDMVRLMSETARFTIANRVVRTQFEPTEDIVTQIEATVSPYRERKLPLLWDTGPVTKPANLGEHLLAFGFNVDHTSPGMAADLHALTEAGNAGPTDLKIERVTDLEMLATFSEMLRDGYGMPDPIMDFIKAAEQQAGVPNPAIFRDYVAFKGTEPVGCSQLILSAGVAGIYGVATIPDARRQGIGAALTRFSLREAREMGYRLGVLHSTEMGFNMYQSLGFQQYCSITSYRWEPD
jgi:ribosomal protein S18 acetylase RimI-like enzyme